MKTSIDTVLFVCVTYVGGEFLCRRLHSVVCVCYLCRWGAPMRTSTQCCLCVLPM